MVGRRNIRSTRNAWANICRAAVSHSCGCCHTVDSQAVAHRVHQLQVRVALSPITLTTTTTTTTSLMSNNDQASSTNTSPPDLHTYGLVEPNYILQQDDSRSDIPNFTGGVLRCGDDVVVGDSHTEYDVIVTLMRVEKLATHDLLTLRHSLWSLQWKQQAGMCVC